VTLLHIPMRQKTGIYK